jgi:hypothetical protein
MARAAVANPENCVRSSRQQDSCWRQPYATAIRLNKPLAHVALQLAKLLRHGRWGQLQRRGRAGYGAEGRHRVKGLETLKVQHFTDPTQYPQ